MLKENKRQLVQTSTCSPANTYTCVLRTPHVCILSLQYIWISSGRSRCLAPTPGLTSENPTVACSVCVCAYTHTRNTYTPTPCKKRGDTSIAQTNPSTLKTDANRRPAGTTPRTLHLHTHAMVFKTPVNSTENTCWAYTRKEKMTTTKWIKMMTETTSTTTTARRKLMQT